MSIPSKGYFANSISCSRFCPKSPWTVSAIVGKCATGIDNIGSLWLMNLLAPTFGKPWRDLEGPSYESTSQTKGRNDSRYITLPLIHVEVEGSVLRSKMAIYCQPVFTLRPFSFKTPQYIVTIIRYLTGYFQRSSHAP